jgi:hypothetical protein
LNGDPFAHADKIVVEAKDCAKQLVLRVVEIPELLRNNCQLAEVSPQVQMAFDPLDHAH